MRRPRRPTQQSINLTAALQHVEEVILIIAQVNVQSIFYCRCVSKIRVGTVVFDPPLLT